MTFIFPFSFFVFFYPYAFPCPFLVSFNSSFSLSAFSSSFISLLRLFFFYLSSFLSHVFVSFFFVTSTSFIYSFFPLPHSCFLLSIFLFLKHTFFYCYYLCFFHSSYSEGPFFAHNTTLLIKWGLRMRLRFVHSVILSQIINGSNGRIIGKPCLNNGAGFVLQVYTNTLTISGRIAFWFKCVNS